MNKKECLDIINSYQKEIVVLSQIGALLDWDEKTGMPRNASRARAEQMALIGKLIHKKANDNKFYEAVNRARKMRLGKDEEVMVKRIHKSLERARKIPEKHVEELARVTSIGSLKWRQARESNNFSVFLPSLQKIVELKRKECEYVGYKGHPYNALLDEFEDGMSVEKIKPMFEHLKFELKDLISKIEASEVYKKQRLILTKKEFNREGQMKMVRDVIERMTLKKDFSRIDFAEHPFESKIGFGDIRITTNIRKDPLFSFGSSIHEGGHALYEAGMLEKDQYNFLGGAPSYGMHESQSRFWENMIGLNKPFWRFYFPKFKKEFKLKGDFEQWYKEVNFIEPGMIRIEGDELHYCLHIILRFELELGLIDGSIKVKDLPKIWNAKMRELFGKEPGSDKEGVLQDVHWSGGAIGYFPTYAIGTIYAAQIYEALKKQIKGIESDIESGKYERVVKWLHENIHEKGYRYLAEELMKRATGEGLNVDVYLDYLKKKYREIYKI